MCSNILEFEQIAVVISILADICQPYIFQVNCKYFLPPEKKGKLSIGMEQLTNKDRKRDRSQIYRQNRQSDIQINTEEDGKT